MRNVSLDVSKLKGFINEHEIGYMGDMVNSAHNAIHNGTGAGNDFLGWLDLPKNYPPWKVQIGLNFNIPVGGRAAKTIEEVESEEFNRQVEFYKLIQDEREKSAEIEDELKELKKEREAADAEIEELKKMLGED